MRVLILIPAMFRGGYGGGDGYDAALCHPERSASVVEGSGRDNVTKRRIILSAVMGGYGRMGRVRRLGKAPTDNYPYYLYSPYSL